MEIVKSLINKGAKEKIISLTKNISSMKNSNQISLSKLAEILPMKEQKEFSVIFLSRPIKRFDKVSERSTIINAKDRFEAFKIASNRYGKNKILSCKEKQDKIRTDNFVTIM